MNRRKFIIGSTAALGLVAVSSGSYLYQEDQNMKPAPKVIDRILADFHAHPANYNPQEETLEMLTRGCLVGLSRLDYPGAKTILTYEQALGLPGVTEIDSGLLAKIKNKSRTGYFIKTQELQPEQNIIHLLALGCRKYISKDFDAKEAIKAIHQQDGLAILNHPYVTVNRGSRIIPYRLINSEEEKEVEEITSLVDEVEVFNAQNINPAFEFVVPNMKKANEQAHELAERHGKKGIAASDAHRRLEQIGITGIYLPEHNLCWESIRDNILTKNFERYEQYVSKWSFVKGMFLS